MSGICNRVAAIYHAQFVALFNYLNCSCRSTTNLLMSVSMIFILQFLFFIASSLNSEVWDASLQLMLTLFCGFQDLPENMNMRLIDMAYVLRWCTSFLRPDRNLRSKYEE